MCAATSSARSCLVCPSLVLACSPAIFLCRFTVCLTRLHACESVQCKDTDCPRPNVSTCRHVCSKPVHIVSIICTYAAIVLCLLAPCLSVVRARMLVSRLAVARAHKLDRRASLTSVPYMPTSVVSQHYYDTAVADLHSIRSGQLLPQA